MSVDRGGASCFAFLYISRYRSRARPVWRRQIPLTGFTAESREENATVSEVRGGCPHDCPDTCAWVAQIEDGRVIAVRGEKSHPVTAGHLCLKVKDYPERVYHPDRLLTPLIRTGAKGSGGRSAFREATWPEAIDAVATGLKGAIDKCDGDPRTVLPFSYMGTQGVIQGASMDRRFFNRIGSTDLDRTICLSAGAWAQGLVYPTWAARDIEESVDSDLVIAWGANMVSTCLHLWGFFTEARKRGARIVCVDPATSKTAKAADIHIRPRPGSDGALALGMLNVIYAEGLADREFLDGNCLGAEELESRAAEWTPERAARATGLTPEEIVEFARLFGESNAPYIKLGAGAQRHADAGDAYRAVLALPAVTGAWGKPGGGAHVHSVSAFVDRSIAMESPKLRPADAGKARQINMVQLGMALNGELDAEINALVCYNANPAVVCPDTNSVLRGLARDDLFTVVIEQMFTPTAEWADVILPATTQLEHLDIMWSWGHRWLTLNRPAIEPVGEARPNSEIFRMLAAAMDFDEEELRASDEELLEEYLAGYPESVRTELVERGFAKVAPGVEMAGAAQLANPVVAALGLEPAPNGGGEVGGGEPGNGDGGEPGEVGGGEPGNGDGGEIGRSRELTLVTPKLHQFLNSTFVNHDRLRRGAGDPVVVISPADAAAAGVADGEMVDVINDRGRVTCRASVSAEILPGVASLASSWWGTDFPGGIGANALTSQDLTDIGGGPIFTAQVRIESV